MSDNFMQEQVTVLMEWWEVDGREGTMYFPCDEFTAQQAAEAYEFPQAIDSITRRTGYGARLSAPGYLDCTDWTVCDTEEEARETLRELFGDDDDDDDDDDDESAEYDDFLSSLGSHVDGTEGEAE